MEANEANIKGNTQLIKLQPGIVGIPLDSAFASLFLTGLSNIHLYFTLYLFYREQSSIFLGLNLLLTHKADK